MTTAAIYHGESSLPRPSFSCCGLLSSLAQKVSACAHYIWEKITALFSYLFCCTQPRQEVLREITPLPSSVHSDLPSSQSIPDLSPPPLLVDQKTYTQEEIERCLPYETLLPPKSIATPPPPTYPADHCNPQQVNYREVVDLVRDCVIHNDRNGLRATAQALLMGPWRRHETCSTFHLDTRWLHNLLYDPEADLLDIGQLLLYAFKQWRHTYTSPFYEDNYMPYTHKKNKKPYLSTVAEVTIQHGGCLTAIQRFLRGQSLGYVLERGDLGLQVSVDNPTDRLSRDYSTRALSRFDIPAILSARISSEHLLPAQGQEAGLPARSIRHLQDQRIQILPIEYSQTAGHRLDYIENHAKDEWKGDLQLARRIFESNRRREEGKTDYSLLPFLNEEKTDIRPLRPHVQEKLEQLRQAAPGYFATPKRYDN